MSLHEYAIKYRSAATPIEKGISSVGSGLKKAATSVGGAIEKTGSYLGAMVAKPTMDVPKAQQALDNKIKKQEDAFLQEMQTARRRTAYGTTNTLLATSVAGDESVANVKSALLG